MVFSIEIPFANLQRFPSVSESQDLRCSVYVFVESNFGHRKSYTAKIIYHEISVSAARDRPRQEVLCSYRFLSIDHGLQACSANTAPPFPATHMHSHMAPVAVNRLMA